MKSYNVNINTGGQITALGHSIKGADGQWRPTTKDDLKNDTGKTHTVEYTRRTEKAWERKDREMTERAADYYGKGSNESALERELWKQIGGSPSQSEFNLRVERGFWRLDMEAARTKDLAMTLFNQVAHAR